MPGTIVGGIATIAWGYVGLAAAYLGVSTFTFVVGVLSVVSAITSFVMQPDMPSMGAGDRAKDRLRNVRQPLSPHRVIYGKTRVGGAISYLHTTDDDEELHQLLSVSGHSIDGFESIYANDKLLVISTDSLTFGNVTNDVDWKDQMHIHMGDGTTSGDSGLLGTMVTQTDGHWTADHKQEGISKLYIRFSYDRDAYGNGLPNITAIVRGKKLYDPRDETTAYSNNSALCILDYLRDSRYGLGEPDANIDMNSFITAANISDETVNLVDYTPSFEVLDPLSISEQSEEVTSSSHSVSIPSGHDGMFQEISIKAKKGSGKYTAFGALRLTVNGSNYAVGGRNSGETLTRCVYANGVTITSSSTYDKNDYYEVGNILDPNLGASHHSTDGYWLAVGDNTITITFDEALPITSISVINNPDNTYYGNRGSDLEFTFLPAPSIPASDILSGNEYVIHEIGTTDFTTIGASSNTVGVKFDSTGTVSGTGRVFLSNFSEARYTCNGTFETSDKPSRILKDLLSTCSGRLAYQGGKWALRVGAYVAPTMTFNEDDFVEPLEVVTQIGRRALFNQAQSIYTSPKDLYQPTDAPVITNAMYIAQDQHNVITRDMEFPFTTSSSTAQRLAKIELERVRQQITVSASFSLKQGLKIQTGDTIGLDSDKLGWVNKPFTVEEWVLAPSGDSGSPTIIVKVSLRETASNVFDWNLGQETTVDAAPDTNLSNSFLYDPPTNAVITEELVYLSAGTKGAGGTIEITSSWDNTNNFINQFHTEFAVYDSISSSWGSWKEGGYFAGLSWKVGAVPLGVYKFRVQGVSSLGRFTTWAVSPDKTLGGLLDDPDDITNFGMDANEGHAAFLTWDEVDDLDVIHGGHLRVKHLPDSHSWDSAVDSIADGWTAASDIGKRITGIATEVLLPLRLGHYFIKAVDSSANESDSAVYVENTTEPKSTAEWLTGSGDPTSTDGVVGDLWINTTSSKLWKKTLVNGVATWGEVVTKLKGDDGEDGAGIEYIFAVTSDSSSTPSSPINTWGFDQPVAPWYDGAPNVTASNKALWQARRVIAGAPDVGDAVSGTWSSSTVVGRYATDGEDGEDSTSTGATGRRTATGYLYYNTAQSSAPNAPAIGPLNTPYNPRKYNYTSYSSGGTTWAAGTFTNTTAGWSTSTPVMQPSSSSAKYWAVHYHVIEASYGSTSQTVTLGSVINSTSFDGVVTFTNNASGGTTGTLTHIAGGDIATGTISLNRLDNSTNTVSGRGNFQLGKDAKIDNVTGVIAAESTNSGHNGIIATTDSTAPIAIAGGAPLTGTALWGGNGGSVGASGHKRIGMLAHSTQAGWFENDNAGTSLSICPDGSTPFAISAHGGIYTNSTVSAGGTGRSVILGLSGVAVRTGVTGGSQNTDLTTGVYGMATQGDVSVGGTTVHFTASHMGLLPNNVEVTQGDILVDTANIVGDVDISNVLSIVEVSTTSNQAGCIGIYNKSVDVIPVNLKASVEGLALEDADDRVKPEYGYLLEDNKVLFMNALGEGRINVVSQGGDISIGDLIVCSGINGKGMKQDDDIVRSYTVAKSRENVAFETSDEVKQVACIYMCG